MGCCMTVMNDLNYNQFPTHYQQTSRLTTVENDHVMLCVWQLKCFVISIPLTSPLIK